MKLFLKNNPIPQKIHYVQEQTDRDQSARKCERNQPIKSLLIYREENEHPEIVNGKHKRRTQWISAKEDWNSGIFIYSSLFVISDSQLFRQSSIAFSMTVNIIIWRRPIECKMAGETNFYRSMKSCWNNVIWFLI